MSQPVAVEVIFPEQPFGGVLVQEPEKLHQIAINTGSPVRSVFGRTGNIVALCTDYDHCYAPLGSGLPPGGDVGQVLGKLTSDSLDVGWIDPPSGIPPGGLTGQVLTKLSDTNFDINWQDPPSTPLDDPTALVGLTPVDGVALTAMRSDAAPALDVAISPTWSGTHTFSNNINVPLIPIDQTHAASKGYVDLLVAPTGSQLLTGGGVAWTGSGLDFIVSAATYLINGDFFVSPETPLTLAPADPTLARIDVFAVDNTGSAVVITGTPGGPPLEPSINPVTQLRLTSVLVPAGSTTPSVTVENIYLENTEWTSSTNSPGTINLASTNFPYQGTKCIEVTNGAAGNFVTLVKPSGTLNPADYTSLTLHIRNKAAWPNPKTITAAWMNGVSVVGLSVSIKSAGFDGTLTGSYQQIVIPASLFNTGSSSADRLRLTISGGGATIGCYIDNIVLQAGGGGGGGATGDFSTNTNVSVAGEMVLFADTTGKLGKRSTGSGAVKLTNGVQGLFAMHKRGIAFGSANSDGIATGKISGYFTMPFAGTIQAWNLQISPADAGSTIGIRFWKKVNGTAVPTVSDSINSADLVLSTGTHVRSTGLGNFTTLAVAEGDIFAVEITTISGGTITDFSGSLEIEPTI